MTETIAVWAEGARYAPESALMPRERIIGNSQTNDMPWPRSHADLENFTRTVKDHVMVMGRKTFESLPDSVKKSRIVTRRRPMVVLTRDPAWAFAQQVFAQENGLQITFGLPANAARLIAWSRATYPDKSIAVIGGTAVIELFRDFYDRLVITWHHSLDGWVGDVPAPFRMTELAHDWYHLDYKHLTPTLTVHEYIPQRKVTPELSYAGDSAPAHSRGDI